MALSGLNKAMTYHSSQCDFRRSLYILQKQILSRVVLMIYVGRSHRLHILDIINTCSSKVMSKTDLTINPGHRKNDNFTNVHITHNSLDIK